MIRYVNREGVSLSRFFLNIHRPFHQRTVSFSQPFLAEDEASCVANVIKGGRLVMGPEVADFEKQVAEYCGQKHAIAVTSGTSALTLSMSSLGIGPRSLVVVPAYTWVATYNAAALLGASVTIADVDDHNFCMDPTAAKLAIESRLQDNKFDNIGALPVHLFGERCPPPLGPIDTIVGDGCCAFSGIDTDGTMCGSWNAIECFSFHPRKVITTGEGGMVVCSDDSTAEQLRILRDHGAYRSAEQRRQTVGGGDMVPDFPLAGFNFRLTEMQGALGRVQMSRIDEIVEVRRRIAALYDSSLSGMEPLHEDEPYIRPPLAEKSGARRVLTMYTVQVRSGKLDALLRALKEDQTYTSPRACLSDAVAVKGLAEEVVCEVNRLKGVRSAGMKKMVESGVIVRPPMISLLDVEHVQNDYFHNENIDLKDDVMKAIHFPGTYVSSSLNFALPLHPHMTVDDAERTANSLRRTFRPDFINRALRLAQLRPHDFTIQYPVRREYFGDNFNVPISRQSKDVSSSAESVPHENVKKKKKTSLAGTTPHYHRPLTQELVSFQQAETIPSPEALAKNREMLMYLHVPFCETKCSYCNFAVDTKNTPARHTTYVSHLASLTTSWVQRTLDSANGLSVHGIDIGGGTPTILSEENLETLLTPLAPLLTISPRGPNFLSIETTPSIASSEMSKMRLLREFGVRRVSVGVQSTNKKQLEGVNRSNQINTEQRAFQNLRDVGFERINADIIFGLPGQTVEEWENDIDNVLELDLDSITTYDCLYKGKGRPMRQDVKRGGIIPPLPALYGKMYDIAYSKLKSRGYHAPYGSVNFSKRLPETGTSEYFENRLLKGKPYVGLGNYASTMIDRYWLFAPYTVDGWIDSMRSVQSQGKSIRERDSDGSGDDALMGHWPLYRGYSLSIEERMAKHVLLGLSFGCLDERIFGQVFPGWSLASAFGKELEELVEKRKWMWHDSDSGMYRLTEGTFHHMPEIRALFYSERCLTWFEKSLTSS